MPRVRTQDTCRHCIVARTQLVICLTHITRCLPTLVASILPIPTKQACCWRCCNTWDAGVASLLLKHIRQWHASSIPSTLLSSPPNDVSCWRHAPLTLGCWRCPGLLSISQRQSVHPSTPPPPSLPPKNASGGHCCVHHSVTLVMVEGLAHTPRTHPMESMRSQQRHHPLCPQPRPTAASAASITLRCLGC